MKQEVSMHYSVETDTFLQYTDDSEKATVICVHTQSYETDCETYTHGSRSGDYEIIDEKLFPNSPEGMKDAEKYAEGLCSKYKTRYEFY